MQLSFSLTVSGVVMNLLGTMLLVFSTPIIIKKFNQRTGAIGIATPDEDQSNLQFALELAREAIFEKENRFICLPLSLMVIGTLFQIVGLWLEPSGG